MTIRNEMLDQIDNVLKKMNPPLKFELITSLQRASEYANLDLWSWEFNEEVISEGLDRKPFGYLFFGLKISDEPAAITIFKRHTKISQEKIPVLTVNGELHNPQTILTFKYLSDLTQNLPVIELGDTYLRGFRSGDMGIFTPFRYGKNLIDHYLNLVKTVWSIYPKDCLMTLPHGIYEWEAEREQAIIESFQQNGRLLTVHDYLNRFNVEKFYQPDALTKIGTVRPISKLTERMVKMSGIPFEVKGYTANDFGPVYLAKSLRS